MYLTQILLVQDFHVGITIFIFFYENLDMKISFEKLWRNIVDGPVPMIENTLH